MTSDRSNPLVHAIAFGQAYTNWIHIKDGGQREKQLNMSLDALKCTVAHVLKVQLISPRHVILLRQDEDGRRFNVDTMEQWISVSKMFRESTLPFDCLLTLAPADLDYYGGSDWHNMRQFQSGGDDKVQYSIRVRVGNAIDQGWHFNSLCILARDASVQQFVEQATKEHKELKRKDTLLPQLFAGPHLLQQDKPLWDEWRRAQFSVLTMYSMTDLPFAAVAVPTKQAAGDAKMP